MNTIASEIPDTPSFTENGAVLCADEMTPSSEEVHVEGQRIVIQIP